MQISTIIKPVMKTSALIAMIAVGLAGAGVFFLSITPSQAPGPGGDWVACTADAMQCPDGSYVGRTGPNCEFVCQSASSTSLGDTGIR